jgi:hypothetical protein
MEGERGASGASTFHSRARIYKNFHLAGQLLYHCQFLNRSHHEGSIEYLCKILNKYAKWAGKIGAVGTFIKMVASCKNLAATFFHGRAPNFHGRAPRKMHKYSLSLFQGVFRTFRPLKDDVFSVIRQIRCDR